MGKRRLCRRHRLSVATEGAERGGGARVRLRPRRPLLDRGACVAQRLVRAAEGEVDTGTGGMEDGGRLARDRRRKELESTREIAHGEGLVAGEFEAVDLGALVTQCRVDAEGIEQNLARQNRVGGVGEARPRGRSGRSAVSRRGRAGGRRGRRGGSLHSEWTIESSSFAARRAPTSAAHASASAAAGRSAGASRWLSECATVRTSARRRRRRRHRLPRARHRLAAVAAIRR